MRYPMAAHHRNNTFDSLNSLASLDANNSHAPLTTHTQRADHHPPYGERLSPPPSPSPPPQAYPDDDNDNDNDDSKYTPNRTTLTPLAIAHKLDMHTLARRFEAETAMERKSRKRRQMMTLSAVLFLLCTGGGIALGYFLLHKKVQSSISQASWDWPTFNKTQPFLFPPSLSSSVSPTVAAGTAPDASNNQTGSVIQLSNHRVIISPDVVFTVYTFPPLPADTPQISILALPSADTVLSLAENYRKYLFPFQDCRLRDTANLPYPLLTSIVLNVTGPGFPLPKSRSGATMLAAVADSYSMVLSATPDNSGIHMAITAKSSGGIARALESLSSLMVITTEPDASANPTTSSNQQQQQPATPQESCMYVVPVTPMTVVERPLLPVRGLYIDMQRPQNTTSTGWTAADVAQAVKYAGWSKLNSLMVNLPAGAGYDQLNAASGQLTQPAATPASMDPSTLLSVNDLTKMAQTARLHGVHLIPRLDLTHPGPLTMLPPSSINTSAWIICRDWCRGYNVTDSTPPQLRQQVCGVLDITDPAARRAQGEWFNGLITLFDGPVHVGDIFRSEYLDCLLTQGAAFNSPTTTNQRNSTVLLNMLSSYYSTLLSPLNKLVLYSLLADGPADTSAAPTSPDGKGTVFSSPPPYALTNTTFMPLVASPASSTVAAIHILPPTFLSYANDPALAAPDVAVATALATAGPSRGPIGALAPLAYMPDPSSIANKDPAALSWISQMAYLSAQLWSASSPSSSGQQQDYTQAVAEFVQNTVVPRVAKQLASPASSLSSSSH
ncbi:hypothetical protein RI367_002399 [Sorochytrium milnesiophthora]